MIKGSGKIVPRIYNVTSGPGGRSSNSGITATVFGGYGFVGRYLLNELGRIGSRVYIPYRGDELEVRHIKPMFDLGGVGFVPFSPRDEATIIESIKSSDVVINLIGKHYETKHLVPTRRANGKLSNINYNFDEVHTDIPRKIAKLAKKAGVRTFIQMSSLTASSDSLSRWSKSKFNGENAVREEFPEAIIVKSAHIFGAEDRFLNWIAEASNSLPFFPLVKNGQTLVQPVYSLDVAKALLAIIQHHHKLQGKTIQLTGPAEYTYKEVVEFVADVTRLRKPLVDIPISIASRVGSLIEYSMNPILTEDNILQYQENSVKINDESVLTLQDLDIEASSMDKYAFDFLHRFRIGGHFTTVEGYHTKINTETGKLNNL